MSIISTWVNNITPPSPQNLFLKTYLLHLHLLFPLRRLVPRSNYTLQLMHPLIVPQDTSLHRSQVEGYLDFSILAMLTPFAEDE
jgi:hypothetical protein